MPRKEEAVDGALLVVRAPQFPSFDRRRWPLLSLRGRTTRIPRYARLRPLSSWSQSPAAALCYWCVPVVREEWVMHARRQHWAWRVRGWLTGLARHRRGGKGGRRDPERSWQRSRAQRQRRPRPRRHPSLGWRRGCPSGSSFPAARGQASAVALIDACTSVKRTATCPFDAPPSADGGEAALPDLPSSTLLVPCTIARIPFVSFVLRIPETMHCARL